MSIKYKTFTTTFYKSYTIGESWKEINVTFIVKHDQDGNFEYQKHTTSSSAGGGTNVFFYKSLKGLMQAVNKIENKIA